jgi:uncharacterized GH25 family protein
MKTIKFLLALSCCLAFTAEAHRAWLLPSATVLSSNDAWVTLDAAVSNDIFHADHAPMRLDDLIVTAPDGKATAITNASTGKFRSSFDLQLPQKGTYKIAIASSGLMATWETAEGERRMWPQRGQKADPKDFATQVPKDAKKLQVTEFSRRMETFVTSGTPSETVLQPTKKGLELKPVTHPNDLFAGEAAEFILLMNGKPAADVKVTVIAGGMRYRNDQQAIEVVTDKKGQFQITWPAAGMYWLTAQYRDDKAAKPATQRAANYSATFEVLPE